MHDGKLSLLIVDDNEDNRDLLEDIFEEKYATHCVDSGRACIDYLEGSAVDLVLLDVNMPNMDGYEVCSRLKANTPTSMTPIIFVSALASTEERLAGYEVGGDEYVTKPFKAEEIKETVARVLESRIQTKNAEIQSKEAMSTAFQAMTNSSELGNIIQFMRDSYTCKSIEMLAQKLLATLSDFGLNSCIMVKQHDHASFYGCVQDSLEYKVLSRFGSADRIVDFGARTLINDEHVSILVKNMPLDRPEDYGRIKDNLAALISGAEARCKAIEIEYKLEHERKHGIQAVLFKSQDTLTDIDRTIDEQISRTSEVIVNINARVEQIVFGLGLDEDQENAIMTAFESAVGEVGNLSEYTENISREFKVFVEELDRLVKG